MRLKSITIGIAFGLMTALMTATWGYESEFDHWNVKSYNTSSGSFDNCVMSLHENENQFLLRLDRQSNLTIGVAQGAWKVRIGETAFFRVFADHSILTSGDAIAIGPDLFVLRLAEMNRAISTMRLARMIMFAGRGTSVTFDLAGIGRALNLLMACIADDTRNRT